MNATKQDIKFDSLPYYDKEIDSNSDIRKAALKSVEDEMKVMDHRDLSKELGYDYSIDFLKSNEILQSELQRISNNEKLQSFNPSKYALTEPLSSNSEDWKECYKSAIIMKEYQHQRQSNLDLLGGLGANAWKLTNYILDADTKQLESHSEFLKNKILDINRLRKIEQTNAGNKLNNLDKQWSSLISNNLELEVAIIQLEMELEELNNREHDLRSKLTA